MSLQLKERIEKFAKREPCVPCEKSKAKLRAKKGLIGGVARKVWPEDEATDTQGSGD